MCRTKSKRNEAYSKQLRQVKFLRLSDFVSMITANCKNKINFLFHKIYRHLFSVKKNDYLYFVVFNQVRNSISYFKQCQY